MNISRSVARIAAGFMLAALAGCGGGDGGPPAGAPYNPLWVAIDTGNLQSPVTTSSTDLSGSAYCGDACPPGETAFGYCPPIDRTLQAPSLNFSWSNPRTGETGAVMFHGIYGSCSCLISYCFTSYSHRWATYGLPLAIGDNVIEIRVSDASGNSATDSVLIKRVMPPTPGGLTAVAGLSFYGGSEGTNGYELWKSDGTAGGTAMVRDITIGAGSSYLGDLTNMNGTLFFVTSDGMSGYELWKSDGTAGGTVMVKDINPGTGSSDPSHLTDVNGTLFFRAFDPAGGYELWKSDGTAGGTVMVMDIGPGTGSSYFGSLTNVNGTLFFATSDPLILPASSGKWAELWKSDGTAGGTVMLKNITGAFSSLSHLTSVNGTLFFVASDGTNGDELWKSDGTAGGTAMVKDINPGTGSSYPSYLTDVNGTLFFVAFNGTNGFELWKSDGTAGGTVMVKDINPGTGSSDPSHLTDVNGSLFFAASDGTNGNELWKSDGTAGGTVMVKNIDPGLDFTTLLGRGSHPSQLINVNGTLFFAASDGTNGYEVWKSDGTADGTVMVKDINPGTGSSDPSHLTDASGMLFFAASDGTNGYELWKSDGTPGGTVMVKDACSGACDGVLH